MRNTTHAGRFSTEQRLSRPRQENVPSLLRCQRCKACMQPAVTASSRRFILCPEFALERTSRNATTPHEPNHKSLLTARQQQPATHDKQEVTHCRPQRAQIGTYQTKQKLITSSTPFQCLNLSSSLKM